MSYVKSLFLLTTAAALLSMVLGRREASKRKSLLRVEFNAKGLPDTSREETLCLACNDMFGYIDGMNSFYPDSKDTDLDYRKEFSQKRRSFVKGLRLEDRCDAVPGLSSRRQKSLCRSLVRHFFEDPVKVALCVGATDDEPSQARYCGCAARSGMPDRGVPSRCPPSKEIESGAVSNAVHTSPLSTTTTTDNERPSSTDETPSSSTMNAPSSFSGTSNERRKCAACMSLLTSKSSNLQTSIFVPSTALTTRDRTKFSMQRRKFLLAMDPRDYCDMHSSGSEDCTNVINFVRKPHQTALCLQDISGNDSAAFCACVARQGGPNSGSCPNSSSSQ